MGAPRGSLSMRTRIVLMNTAILAALFGAIGAALPPLVRAAMYRSIDRELLDRTRRFAGPPPGPGLRFPGGRGLPDGPQAPDEANSPSSPARPGPPDEQPDEPAGGPGTPRGPFGPPEPPTVAGTVLRPREIPLKPEARRPAPPAPWDASALRTAQSHRPVYSTVAVDGEPVRVLSVALPPDGEPRSILQIPYPLSEVERAVGGLSATLLALAPLALLAAGAGGYFLTGRALRPVSRMTVAAEEIGAADLARRIPVEGDDEFARLATTFNGMLERLGTAFGERERLIAQLREMVERQRRFTADASHELKTPLTAIKANTSLLLSGSPDEHDYREATKEIDSAASLMARLVQDLLLLARSDAGQLVRESLPVPLVVPIARAVEQVRRGSAAHVCSEVPPDIVVSGEEDALTRLFANLLDNAARHTPENGSIRVRAGLLADEVVVEVEDSGSGIAPEHLPHVGERFYRVDTHRARAHGGTGLGLAICREIAAAHGGSLEIASTVGRGTTVTVRLPLSTN